MNIRLVNNEGVMHTLSIMSSIVDLHKTDVWARKAVAHIVRDNRLQDGDVQGLCDAVDAWVRERVTYWPDIDGVETIQSPVRTLELGIGDCDDMCVLAATLLRAAGHGTAWVLIGYESHDQPEHVCVLHGGVVIDPTVAEKERVLMGAKYMEVITWQ